MSDSTESLYRAVPAGMALMLGGAGLLKIAGAAPMRKHFAHWGYSSRFMRVVGAAELATAALIATRHHAPALTLFTALMVGASATHLKTRGERPLFVFPLATLGLYAESLRRLQR